MLAIERRKKNDPRSLAEIFFEVYDQVGDVKFEKAIQLILSLLQDILRNPLIELSDEQIDMIHTEFILGLPEFIRTCIARGSCGRHPDIFLGADIEFSRVGYYFYCEVSVK
jgi:hypothetical protein